MKESKNRVALVSSAGAHPTTIECAKAAGVTDFYNIERKRENGFLKSFYLAFKLTFQIKGRYDVYVIESALPMIPLLIRRYFFFERAKIIHRANAGEYNLILGNEPLGFVNRVFTKILLSRADGMIAVSDLVKNQIKKIFPNKKVFVARDFVIGDDFEKLKPNMKAKNFVFVGNYLPPYDHKDIEGLIKNFNRLYEENLIESKLFILGKDTEKLKALVRFPDRIEIVGFADPKKYFAKSTFYVHNAKFEAGGTVVLEAMTSGLIPIISDETGTKDFLKAFGLDSNVFKYSDFDSFREVILKNYALSSKSIYALSKKIILHQNELSVLSGRQNFKKQFDKLISNGR